MAFCSAFRRSKVTSTRCPRLRESFSRTDSGCVKILFHASTPAPLAYFLRGHQVVRTDEPGWQGLETVRWSTRPRVQGLTCRSECRIRNVSDGKPALVSILRMQNRLCEELDTYIIKPAVGRTSRTTSVGQPMTKVEGGPKLAYVSFQFRMMLRPKPQQVLIETRSLLLCPIHNFRSP